MLRFLLVVASVSLQRATAFKVPECQEHLAQQAALQAALEVGDKGVVKRPEWKWGGHTFNNTRYTTVAGIDPATSCGANFTGVIRDHDVTYVTVRTFLSLFLWAGGIPSVSRSHRGARGDANHALC